MSDIPVSDPDIKILSELRERLIVRGCYGDGWTDVVDATAIGNAIERLRTAQPKGESGVHMLISYLEAAIADENDGRCWISPHVANSLIERMRFLKTAPMASVNLSVCDTCRNDPEVKQHCWDCKGTGHFESAPSPSAVATSSGEGEDPFDHAYNCLCSCSTCTKAREPISPPAKASGAFEGVTEAEREALNLAIHLIEMARPVSAKHQAELRTHHAALRSLASRLTRGYAAGWQPIETAPKELAILAWQSNWGYGREVYWCAGTRSDGWYLSNRGPEDSWALVDLTHWQPLPPAPYVSAESEGAGS